MKLYTNLTLMLCSLIIIASVRCCEKQTFKNVEIKPSRYFRTSDDDDIKVDNPFSGCISPVGELKDALHITIVHQKVPILFEDAVEDMPRLHELILEHNGIEEIKPGAFVNLPQLVTLNLANNALKSIPEGVFNKMAVKRLSLKNNVISSIAARAFDNMPHLNTIDLDNNRLNEWNSNWFTDSPNIRFLSINFNEIGSLPANAFKNFKGRHEQEDGSRPVITSIYMSNNRIEKIDRTAFVGLKDLQFLDLDKNAISDIKSNTFGSLKNVQHLLLNNNKITCMSKETLNALPVTELTTVDSNPINCQCLKTMKEWAKTHKVNLHMHIRSIECMQERIQDILGTVKKTDKN